MKVLSKGCVLFTVKVCNFNGVTDKGHDGSYEVAHYPEEEKVPMMFSYITKSFFGKKKISLRNLMILRIISISLLLNLRLELLMIKVLN